jgi:hypothetical protein
MPKPPIDPTAPNGWNNILSGDTANIVTCADMITNSTQTSGINNALSPGDLDALISRRRVALWLRSDGLATLAFHTLDGPTVPDPPKRTPKYCVCTGIDQSLTPLPDPLPHNDPTYQSIRDAVIAFAKNNESRARLFITVAQGNGPVSGDWIYPIFQRAINHDIASKEGETSHGASETYHQSASGRWPTNLTTWKLKKSQDA